MWLGPKVYDNQKANRHERRRQKAKEKTRKVTERKGMSEPHCDAIRSLSCCVCGKPPRNQIHHLKQTGQQDRGGARRSADQWGLPLCWLCHDGIERLGSRNEIAWFRSLGIDALVLADRLWRASPNVEAMERIVLRHRTEIFA
jgi:hypothetical protein